MGVSFAPNSTINRRLLAAALLDEAEIRGTDASGFAWVRGNESGEFKKDVRGSLLSVVSIPDDAEAIILHTRAATTGEPGENANNHPVMSPDGTIRLVHNGVIYNHKDVRDYFGPGLTIPEVDTAVMPAMLQEEGLEGMALLAGDAAAAWFDQTTGRTIHLGRFSRSPVETAYLEDGSFIFASTDRILARALDRAGVRWFGSYPNSFASMPGSTYYQIVDGVILNVAETSWNHTYWSQSRNSRSQADLDRQRQITDGHRGGWSNVVGTPHTTTTTTVVSPAKPAVTPVANDEEFEEYDDYGSFEESGYPAVLEGRVEYVSATFYSKSHNGDYVEYRTLQALIAALRWYSSVSGGAELVSDDSGELRWVNHFEDVGELTEEVDEDDDPTGAIDETSWVLDQDEMRAWGDAVPAFIRDGVEVLRKVRV